MKLADRTVETHSSGITSSSGFNIAQTSKMFKILSDSLYSDKIMAVIREISTNAQDAHIESGNKKPFVVHLPNVTEPEFSVRDYGTGLSKRDMEELYTTYGASSKNDSNDYVGCLGLGSKSPFAYSNSFTTASYFNGKKYTYVASIDETGIPSLNLFNVADTTEANGLQISFAVKTSDFEAFCNKAKRVYHYFKNKPLVIGGSPSNGFENHKYSKEEIITSGVNWKVLKISSYSNDDFPSQNNRVGSSLVAIMGDVAYPVNINMITGSVKEEDSVSDKWTNSWGSQKKKNIHNWSSFLSEIDKGSFCLEINFNIGELEMDVSRESLQYTKAVIKTIKDKVEEAYLSMRKQATKDISESKTKIEAMRKYYSLEQIGKGWNVGATWTDAHGVAHKIEDKDIVYKIESNKNLLVFNYKSPSYRSKRLVCPTDRIHVETINGVGYYASKAKSKVVFFYRDIKSLDQAQSIVTRYCNQNTCFAYLLSDRDHAKSLEGFDTLVEDVGKENILPVSDYKNLMKNTSSRSRSGSSGQGQISKDDIFILCCSDPNKELAGISAKLNNSNSLSEIDDDYLFDIKKKNKDMIYIPIDRYSSILGYNDISLVKLGISHLSLKVDVFCIKNSSVNIYKKQGYKLVDFNDYVNQLVSNMKKEYKEEMSYLPIVEKETNEVSMTYNKKDNSQYECCVHMLNIFGLDYSKFISDKNLVRSIDQFLIKNFFAVVVVRDTIATDRFKREEYMTHIEGLFKKYNISTIHNLPERIISCYQLSIKILALYNDLKRQETHKSFVEAKSTCILETFDEIAKNISMVLDKNPLIEYICSMTSVSHNLTGLQKSNDPIESLQGMPVSKYRYSNYKQRVPKIKNNSQFRVQVARGINS